MSVFSFFTGKKEDSFIFPNDEKDIKNIKETLQFFQRNDSPYIRTVATILQKEPRRTQYLVLKIIKLLSHA